MTYYMIERKRESGGNVAIGMSENGFWYSASGPEHALKFANFQSARGCADYAESRLQMYEGLVGKLLVVKVEK